MVLWPEARAHLTRAFRSRDRPIERSALHYWPLPTNVSFEPGRQMKPPEHTDIMPQYLNEAGYPSAASYLKVQFFAFYHKVHILCFLLLTYLA
jgi:hypothetical protein